VDVEFLPIGPRRTFEGAVDQIAQRIRMGELEEGDRLPSERELAAAMQISRPTLREAVRVLVSAGVLSVRQGSAGGIFVASGYVPSQLLHSKSELRIGEIDGVLQARRLLEPRVAQLAARTATDADYAALQATIDAQAALLEASGILAVEDRFLQYDTQFHLRIARATGNTTIVALMRTLLRRLELARDQALHHESVAEWAIGIHEQTVAAIRSGDDARIDRVMDEHLSALEREWDDAF
jgi:GntR family transcriptional regulator, transcriptional repressor for pyruvate dehydrogenase complex